MSKQVLVVRAAVVHRVLARAANASASKQWVPCTGAA